MSSVPCRHSDRNAKAMSSLYTRGIPDLRDGRWWYKQLLLISNELQSRLLIATYPPKHTHTQTKIDTFFPSNCFCNEAAAVKIELSETHKEWKRIVFLRLLYLWDWIVLQCNRCAASVQSQRDLL